MSQNRPIDRQRVHAHITDNLDGVAPQAAWGEIAYFYNPGLKLKRGTYFATIKDKDGANDRASGLDGTGDWRLNIGVRRETFISLFGGLPARPAKGGVTEGPWDFRARDLLMPHPVYAWMGWVAVISPSATTWDAVRALLADAHGRAGETFDRRIRARDGRGNG